MASTSPFPGTAFRRSGHDHDVCLSEALAAAERVCRARAARLTPLRRKVLELIWRDHAPVRAYDLVEKLRQDRNAGPVAPPTVYRALDFLLAHNLVHKIESMNAFLGCSRPDDGHSAEIMVCITCGRAAELDDARVGEVLHAAAAEVGFKTHNAVVEITGECAECVSGGSRSSVRQ